MVDGQVLVGDPGGEKPEGVNRNLPHPTKGGLLFRKVDLLPVLESVIPQSADGAGAGFWSLLGNALSSPSILEKRWWKEAGKICLVMKDSCNQETFCLLQELVSMLLSWKITCMSGVLLGKH